MKVPISVIIITYNEEGNIVECIKSVYDWVDEIFVVDSFSTDNTLEIARKFTDNIYQHPFKNFAQQRNWAQDNLPIKNDWVMHLDADERASNELAALARKYLSSCPDADGFMMPRRTVFRGKWIRFGGHYPVYQLRLFKKELGRSEQRFYDQNYIVKGRVKSMPADIINIINEDLSLWKANHRKWAKLEAQEVLFNNKRVLNLKLLGSPVETRNWLRYNFYYKLPLFIRVFLYFFYRYFLRFGFLDGKEGLVFHFWQGFWYRYLVDKEIVKLNSAKNKIARK